MSMIAKAVKRLTDSVSVKKAASIVSETCWRVNQVLTPESLKTIEARELKALFIKVGLRQIYSVAHEKETIEIATKVKQLENRPIGGGWL